MKILIGAMQEELHQIVDDLKMVKVENSLVNEFKTNDGEVVLAWIGIGIANASAGLSYLLTKYQNKVEYVINLGTAGCLYNDLHQSDLVIVNKATYSMADSTGMGYVYGQLPSMPAHYESNPELMAKIKTAVGSRKHIIGNTATSDTFFESHDKVKTFIDKIPFDVQIAEMECAGFAQTAAKFNVPFAALKIVSDIVGGDETNELQFDQFLPVAANVLSEVAREIIKR
ncbi:5'-methylthioadenosine/S-adenosylhomocysteine nucleosidase [Mesoplasma photuris]|uniref:5'-methylthioadenosine/S-adenosylhomocysteine nucleosidase n=1 Tax=Mesoplasma photuris TaxID=217731 RepID=UPI0004E1976E|nr:5'-methylthioadenosine/S-adenosylhomocysteine nucleosidase [Mesoplasma photuris]